MPHRFLSLCNISSFYFTIIAVSSYFLCADPVHTGAEAECIASAADERSIDPANHFIFFHSSKSQRCNKTFISKTLFQLSFVCFVRFIIRNRSGISAEPMRLSYVLSDTCFIFVLTNRNLSKSPIPHISLHYFVPSQSWLHYPCSSEHQSHFLAAAICSIFV